MFIDHGFFSVPELCKTEIYGFYCRYMYAYTNVVNSDTLSESIDLFSS